jgi:hypothetical protein
MQYTNYFSKTIPNFVKYMLLKIKSAVFLVRKNEIILWSLYIISYYFPFLFFTFTFINQ